MAYKGNIDASWANKKASIKIKTPTISFVEDGVIVIYAPTLEVYGYGKTKEEAQSSFHICLSQFLSYIVNKGTIEAELKRLGWKIRKKHKDPLPPNMEALLRDNENFSRIFNDFNFTKEDKEIEIPVLA